MLDKAAAPEAPSLPARISGMGPALKWRSDYGRELEGNYEVDFRFGTGAWAELNTNAALSMGATEVAAGRYYLGIRRRLPRAWELMLMHPDPLDRRRLDAGFTGQVKPDITVPLQFSPLSAAEPELKVEFLPDPDAIGRATLRIRFGSYQVETPVVPIENAVARAVSAKRSPSSAPRPNPVRPRNPLLGREIVSHSAIPASGPRPAVVWNPCSSSSESSSPPSAPFSDPAPPSSSRTSRSASNSPC